MNVKLLAILIFSSLVSSCGTTKLSSKELTEIDSGKKAILQTYNQPLIGSLIFEEQPVTQIISIDGKMLDSAIFRNDEKIAIKIGTHKIKFGCVSRSGPDERDYAEVMELKIKPHHKYLVRCSFNTDMGSDGTYSGSFSVKEKRMK